MKNINVGHSYLNSFLNAKSHVYSQYLRFHFPKTDRRIVQVFSITDWWNSCFFFPHNWSMKCMFFACFFSCDWLKNFVIFSMIDLWISRFLLATYWQNWQYFSCTQMKYFDFFFPLTDKFYNIFLWYINKFCSIFPWLNYFDEIHNLPSSTGRWISRSFLFGHL